MAGYHTKEILKGTLGDITKITEEYEEFLDAITQDNPIMALAELSDMLGAIEAYTLRKYNINLADLMTMSDATKRAFQSGRRT